MAKRGSSGSAKRPAFHRIPGGAWMEHGISCNVYESARIKTARLSISGRGELSAVVPRGFRKDLVQAFLERKRDWIPISEDCRIRMNMSCCHSKIIQWQRSDAMKKMMKAVHSIREMMKNHIQAMDFLWMPGCHYQNRTERENNL